MRKARTTPSLFLLFAFLSVVSFFLARGGQLAPVKDVALRASAPVETLLTGVANGVRDLVSGGRELQALRDRNAELQAQVDQLSIELVHREAVETENAELRRLLKFAQESPSYDLQAAQVSSPVIGQDPNNLISSILIGYGKEQGARQGMPVVTERGMVGRIQAVATGISQVLLITDPNSSVTVVLKSSGQRGMVHGQAGNTLLMDQIPQDAVIQMGDIVLTSGLGDLLPRNLVIGQVVEVRHKDYEAFQQAVIRPTVDFSQLEKVLVITNYPLPNADSPLSPNTQPAAAPAGKQ